MSKEQTQDQAQDATHVLVIGIDAAENAVVIEALQHFGTPLMVEVKNLMPRNISLPGLTTEVLEHVAAGPEKSTATGTILDHASLVRLAGNVQAVCQLNDYRNGIAIKALNVKSEAEAEAQAQAEEEARAAAAAKAKAEEEAEAQAKEAEAAKPAATGTKAKK